MKNIWVVYSSRKGGHKYPAESLADFLEKHHNDKFTVNCLNFLDYSPLAALFDRAGRYGDLKLKKIWKRSYKSLRKDNKKVLSIYKRMIRAVYASGRIKEKLLSSAGVPHVIISIQPELNAMSGMLKAWFGVPIYTAIIDLVAHGLWVDKNIDYYFIPHAEMQEELLSYGVREDNIITTGLPIREGFKNVVEKDKIALRKELSMEPHLPSILILGGLLGEMVDFVNVIESIRKVKVPHQIIGIFGKNSKAKKRAEEIEYPYPLYPKGVTENIYDWMWASDIVITKPGSVTIAEITALSKPVILITPVAGSFQETLFAQLIQKKQAGEWVETADNVGEHVGNLLSSPELMKRVSNNAKAFGQKNLHSIDSIANFIIQGSKR